MYINHGCKSKHIISNEWAIVIPLILDDLIIYFKNGSYFPRDPRDAWEMSKDVQGC